VSGTQAPGMKKSEKASGSSEERNEKVAKTLQRSKKLSVEKSSLEATRSDDNEKEEKKAQGAHKGACSKKDCIGGKVIETLGTR